MRGKVKKISLKWLVPALAMLVVAYMGWNLVFSDHGYLVYREELAEFQALKSEVAELKQEQSRLAKDILALREDPKVLEALIHRELGYVYPDEYMVIFPQPLKTP